MFLYTLIHELLLSWLKQYEKNIHLITNTFFHSINGWNHTHTHTHRRKNTKLFKKWKQRTICSHLSRLTIDKLIIQLNMNQRLSLVGKFRTASRTELCLKKLKTSSHFGSAWMVLVQTIVRPIFRDDVMMNL